jgi:hypothetical protein
MKKQTEENQMNESALKAMVDLRDRTLQKSRIAFNNRLVAISNHKDTADTRTIRMFIAWRDRFAELEREADAQIIEMIEDYPMIDELVKIKGIGKILAAKLVSAIDIRKDDTVSALWRYAGYAVIDGEIERKIKGERLHYNQALKKNLYLVAGCFMKSKSPYCQIYYSAKEYYKANRSDWKKMQIHRAATRRMIKIFLSHLWEFWREYEGLEIRTPYVQERLGHNHKFNKEDFGWPKKG